ncbi:LysR family transcriptional regulator [Actinoplanes sp. NPDC051859]|uniref:LysR family transcriptional regulator n=1 Tax=Actinoplanes sp. NPDC051859 TaxID=3363909 RepID=UPI0037918C20
MDPGQLRLLALIGRHGSMAATAEALGLTPAAVTQQVARAERELGTRLVHRGPRGASLTAAGELLSGYGHSIDAATAEAADRLDALRGRLSVRLRIGAFQAAALRLLPPALTTLRHRFPDADLSVTDIRSDQGVDEVAAGRLDMAVLAAWDEPLAGTERVAVHRLMRDPMVLVLPDDHALAAAVPAGAALGLDRLGAESWVTIRAGHAARAQFDRAAAAAGFAPRVRFETESYDVAQALVGTGFGVALVSRLALIAAPGTTHREVTSPGLHRDVFAVTAADSGATPLVGVFLGLLHDVAADITAGWPER